MNDTERELLEQNSRTDKLEMPLEHLANSLTAMSEKLGVHKYKI